MNTSKRKAAAVAILTVGLLGGGLQAGRASSGQDLAESRPSWGVAGERHEFVAAPDGLRYRGPWVTAKRQVDESRGLHRQATIDGLRASLRSLASPPSGLLADVDGLAGGASSSAPASAATDAPYLLYLAAIGDIDGDAVGDLFSATLSDDFNTITATARSGATGTPVWQRQLDWNSLIIPAQIAGRQGFLGLHLTVVSKDGMLRDRDDVTITVKGLDGLASELWSRDLKGSAVSGPLKTQLTDIPFLEALADVQGDGSDELAFVYANSTIYHDGIRRDRAVEALGVMDLSNGSIRRGGDVSAVRLLRSVADLDGDGKRELLENRHGASGDAMVLLGVNGEDRWSRAVLDDEYWFFDPQPADLDGDGGRDLLYVSLAFDCDSFGCRIDVATHAIDGSTGATLASFVDKFPFALAQVDDDALHELQLFEAMYVGETDEYGYSVEVFDLSGETNYRVERLEPQPEDPWVGSIFLFDAGDVDADMALDHAWEFARYKDVRTEDGWDYAYEVMSSGRASGATGSPIAGAPVGWPAYATFDGQGDDYLDVLAPPGDPTLTFQAADGLSGNPLWNSGAVTVGYDAWGGLLSQDMNGDGRDDLVVVAFADPDPEGTVTQLRFFMLDGATGELRWLQSIEA